MVLLCDLLPTCGRADVKGDTVATSKTQVARTTPGTVEPSRAGSDVAISPDTIAMFAQMAMAVPDAEGSGSENIVLAILGAKSWDDLDDPWKSNKTDTLIGHTLCIKEIMRRPSSFADGLGIFLVVRGKDMDQDEDITFTTGSVSVVAQLVKAFLLNAFPLYCVLRQSERPTERGYYPHHLEMQGSGGEPIKVVAE